MKCENCRWLLSTSRDDIYGECHELGGFILKERKDCKYWEINPNIGYRRGKDRIRKLLTELRRDKNE